MASAKSTGTRLVIVESPAKARKISSYLGRGYVVESSMGHIRDLPRSAADVPAKFKGESWARLGVDVDQGFQPLYVVTADRRQQVSKLKKLLADASELYLATDEDREGEAIAWHLLEILKPTVPIRRMVFHEITPQAILAAVANPRELDLHLVDAYETRRILDRLYGYEVSPVLWKKVMPKLSAGRVQSVATRIVVERERERMRFRAAGYWDIEGTFTAGPGTEPPSFTANLVALDGRRVATGRDFAPETGQVRGTALALDETAARDLAGALHGVGYLVTGVETKPYTRRPYPPFMTSTLQQEASRKLRFGVDRTMRIAQSLYENGYITYMRTDSTNLSDTALTAARTQARELYGPEYVPDQPRRYLRKVKNAQEAHEAVRPAGDAFRTPGELAGELSQDEFRLYELIWRRTVASQMTDARGNTMSLRLAGTAATGAVAEFAASGKTISFHGFLRAYVETLEDESAEADDAERRLPAVTEGQPVDALGLLPKGHTTQPPARYTEASLVKAMEELGIGRPSTYASIMRTIADRGYVWRKGSALVPSWVAFAVVQLLERHFARLVDYDFTASVEEDLEDIASGGRHSSDWLTRFYFGSPEGRAGGIARAGGLKALVNERLGEIDARGVNSIPLFDGVVVRVGRYGPYLQRATAEPAAPGAGSTGAEEGERANLPDELPPDELTPAKAEELFAQPSGERELGADPTTGETVVVRAGRYGPYVRAGARTASLFGSMTVQSVTLEEALRLLTLPRALDPEGEITAQNGRYGPYVKRGSESRSLETEEQLFTITLEQALALLAQPKTRGRGTTTPPLRELGADPATGQPMVIKDGRFGPYVTDGATNASLRKGDDTATLTVERAAELLAERRAAAPPAKKAVRASSAGKAPARKAAAKKVAAKTAAAKKVAAKKAAAT